MNGSPPPELVNFFTRSIPKILDLDGAITDKNKSYAITGVIEIIAINMELIHKIYGTSTANLETDGRSIPLPNEMDQFRKDLHDLLSKTDSRQVT